MPTKRNTLYWLESENIERLKKYVVLKRMHDHRTLNTYDPAFYWQFDIKRATAEALQCVLLLFTK